LCVAGVFLPVVCDGVVWCSVRAVPGPGGSLYGSGEGHDETGPSPTLARQVTTQQVTMQHLTMHEATLTQHMAT